MNVSSVNGLIYKYFKMGKQATTQLPSGFKTHTQGQLSTMK